MSTAIDLSFPHTFAVDVVEELPGGASPLRYFPRDRAASQDGVLVRVSPESAPSWLGLFAFGRHGSGYATRVVGMPDPNKLCVVANGAGYVVAAAKPDEWEVVPAVPIVDVQVALAANVVVFANNTELLAYDMTGLKWRTKRIAWDSLSIVAMHERTLVGEYWDMRQEATQRFEVDLATGEVRGGVE